MNNKKIRVAIAGYGILGKVRFANIIKFPCFDVVAISDFLINDLIIEKGIKTYTNYVDMLDDDSLKYDAVFVCLTNDSNSEATIHALNRGAHVFCEKPPGRNVEDMYKVIEAEKRNVNKKLMYGFNHRYHDSVEEALRILRSNKLGKVINMRGVYGKSKLTTFNQTDWRINRDIAGGRVLLDQGIHMVDLMRLFAGEFTTVYSFVENSCWNYDVEDNVYALMRTKNGIVSMLNSSATQWRHKFHLDVNFEKGSLVLSGILSGSKSYGAETLTVVSANLDSDHGNPKEVTTKYNTDLSWYKEIEEFYNCVLNNKKVTSGTSYDSLKTMELVYKIYCSDEKWKQKYNLRESNNYE